MEFHGVSRGEHSAQDHHVTKCMHDHSHYKMEADTAKAAASVAKAQSQQMVQQQGEGNLSLSAWLENRLSKGKSLLSRFWNGSEISAATEAGDRSGQEQVLAQISDSRNTTDAASQSVNTPVPDGRQAESLQTVHVSRAAQAVPAAQPRTQETSDAAGSGQSRGQEGNLWNRMRVRFKDITGELAGHLRGNTSRFQAKRSFQPKQKNVREEPSKTVKTRRDAVQISTYHVEESYLLDSYDRKGEYSKISTKK